MATAGVGLVSPFLAYTQKNIAFRADSEFSADKDWQQVLKEVPLDGSFSKAFQRYQELVGLGPMAKWQEGKTATPDQFKMGPKKDLWLIQYGTQATFGRQITRLLQYPLIGAVGGELGYSANLTLNQLASIILDNATATTYHSGADTTALLSASHTTYGEGAASWNNIISSNAALGYAALQDAFVVAENTVNLRGYSKPVKLSKAIVPTALMNTIKVLIETPYKPGTDANDISTTFKTLTFDINHYMTQGAYWFVRSADHMVVISFLDKFATKTWADDDTESVTTRGSMWFLHGIFTQRGWTGSTGAA